MPSSPRALLTLLALAVMLIGVGCESRDLHTFASTSQRPTTLTLIDIDRNESVWEMDIPVNHQLVLDFENNLTEASVDASGVAPSWVDWQLYRIDDQPVYVGEERDGVPVRGERLDLTGTNVRMQVSFRPAPEIPGSLDAAPVPVVDTAESVAAEAAAEARAQSQAAEQEAAQEAEVVTEEAAEVVEEVEEATEDATK
jgi:hypothetical protein